MTSSELIIFDLDGTLVDSNPDLVASVNHVRQRFSLSPLEDNAIRSMIGDGAEMLIRRSLGGDVSDDTVQDGLEEFLGYYREHMLDNTVLYPGVIETLEALSDYKLAVLTNKPWRFSCLMLEGLGIYERFRAVYGGNSFSEKKPHPVGIRQILADTMSEAAGTWMVGDSSVDVLTGRNAGVRTCGVTYGYAPHTFESHPPDVQIERFEELTGVV
jgi:phosphoglycolate phosphatase